ncbi:MAG: DUF2336 domain-containing protein [Alphaproteobacteria bacterium]|nr:DUF2336 domain-containing protein [Alphaproteobacteria bacterium]
MTEEHFTKKDIELLKSDIDGKARIKTAEKLSHQFSHGELSEEQNNLAKDIFRIMVKDAEERVREALSQNLKENPNIPHDIAVSLANDIDAVSLPMIQCSEVLTNKDLIQIVNSMDEEKQKAVASREHLESNISDALVDKGTEDVVVALVSNKSANIAENSFNKVLSRFGNSEAIQKPMINRNKLPITVAERLVTKVSEELQKRLLSRHELPSNIATDIILQTRERATIALSTESSENDVSKLVAQLSKHNRLTPSIILRALCMGDLMFFEYAMAVFAEVSIENARVLIHDSGALGLKRIYQTAQQPMSLYPAVRVAIDSIKEMQYDGGDMDRERYSRRMIERILTQYDSMGIVFENDDIEYLITKMGELPATLETN